MELYLPGNLADLEITKISKRTGYTICEELASALDINLNNAEDTEVAWESALQLACEHSVFLQNPTIIPVRRVVFAVTLPATKLAWVNAELPGQIEVLEDVEWDCLRALFIDDPQCEKDILLALSSTDSTDVAWDSLADTHPLWYDVSELDFLKTHWRSI